MISEFPLGTPPEAKNFPLRNRIISGLSRGVLIIESGAKSGALITCCHAIEQGRPVFAVPGSVFNRKADGPNMIIQQGGHLVMHPADIWRYFRSSGKWYPAGSSKTGHQSRKHDLPIRFMEREKKEAVAKISHHERVRILSEQEQIIYRLFSHRDLHLDRLCELSGSAPHALIIILLSLEMKGFVKRKPGSVYSKSV
jgi:DNA processing protein